MGVSADKSVKGWIGTIYKETPTPKKLLKNSEITDKRRTSRDKLGCLRFDPENVKKLATDNDGLPGDKKRELKSNYQNEAPWTRISKKGKRFEPILEKGNHYSARERGKIKFWWFSKNIRQKYKKAKVYARNCSKSKFGYF